MADYSTISIGVRFHWADSFQLSSSSLTFLILPTSLVTCCSPPYTASRNGPYDGGSKDEESHSVDYQPLISHTFLF